MAKANETNDALYAAATDLCDTLEMCFRTKFEESRGEENANITDVLGQLARNVKGVYEAITVTAVAGTDAAGGHVSCLTEAVMGVTAGLFQIAAALESVADALASKED